MREKLVTVAWIKNDVDPEVGFIGVIAHDREIEGAYAVVRRSCAESLLAKRDATIARQAERIERLTVERDEARRTVRMAHEEGTKLSEQLEALAEQNEKMRKVIAKSRELVCAGAECGFNPIPSKWADELFYNQAD